MAEELLPNPGLGFCEAFEVHWSFSVLYSQCTERHQTIPLDGICEGQVCWIINSPRPILSSWWASCSPHMQPHSQQSLEYDSEIISHGYCPVPRSHPFPLCAFGGEGSNISTHLLCVRCAAGCLTQCVRKSSGQPCKTARPVLQMRKLRSREFTSLESHCHGLGRGGRDRSANSTLPPNPTKPRKPSLIFLGAQWRNTGCDTTFCDLYLALFASGIRLCAVHSPFPTSLDSRASLSQGGAVQAWADYHAEGRREVGECGFASDLQAFGFPKAHQIFLSLWAVSSLLSLQLGSIWESFHCDSSPLPTKGEL